MRLFSMTVPTVASSVASRAASARTSIDSLTCPTCNSKSTRAACMVGDGGGAGVGSVVGGRYCEGGADSPTGIARLSVDGAKRLAEAYIARQQTTPQNKQTSLHGPPFDCKRLRNQDESITGQI